MRGGEIILDLKNIDHTTGVAVKHPGIYGLIENTRKPVRFCNVVANGEEFRDFIPIPFTMSGTTYVASVVYKGDWNITISDTDEVTFTSQ